MEIRFNNKCFKYDYDANFIVQKSNGGAFKEVFNTNHADIAIREYNSTQLLPGQKKRLVLKNFGKLPKIIAKEQNNVVSQDHCTSNIAGQSI